MVDQDGGIIEGRSSAMMPDGRVAVRFRNKVEIMEQSDYAFFVSREEVDRVATVDASKNIVYYRVYADIPGVEALIRETGIPSDCDQDDLDHSPQDITEEITPTEVSSDELKEEASGSVASHEELPVAGTPVTYESTEGKSLGGLNIQSLVRDEKVGVLFERDVISPKGNVRKIQIIGLLGKVFEHHMRCFEPFITGLHEDTPSGSLVIDKQGVCRHDPAGIGIKRLISSGFTLRK
jgi:hypothetical protein